MRLDKHDLNMSMAFLASKQGTCHNKSVGSIVFIQNHRFIGYTGNLPKQKHCKEIYNDKDEKFPCNCMSAELNAVAMNLKSETPVSTSKGGILYTTDSIDLDKLNQLATFGIKEIVYAVPIEKEKDEIQLFANYNDIKLLCYADYNEVINENVSEAINEINNILLNINK